MCEGGRDTSDREWLLKGFEGVMLRLEGLTLVRVAGRADRRGDSGSPPVTPRYGPVTPQNRNPEVDRNVLRKRDVVL